MIFLLAQESKSHYNSIPHEKVVLINIHYDAYDTDTAFYSVNMFEIHLVSGHSSEHRRGEKVYRKTHVIICNRAKKYMHGFVLSFFAGRGHLTHQNTLGCGVNVPEPHPNRLDVRMMLSRQRFVWVGWRPFWRRCHTCHGVRGV